MREHEEGLLSFVLNLAAVVLVVTVLRIGREVIVPIVLASLLAFLLSPLVVRLSRRGLGRTGAVVVTSGLAFTVIACLGWLVLTQALELARELPSYEKNIEAKIARLRLPEETSISRVAEMAARFERELFAPAVSLESEASGLVQVQVQPTRSSTFGAMAQIAGPVLKPLAMAGVVAIFMIAILLQRENLRDRVFRAVNPVSLDVAARAFNDAAHRVSRYLGMQLVVNASFGLFVALGLLLIGIPNVVFWGLFAMLLRFIPYAGAWIAAAFPMILAIGIDPGWSKLVSTLVLFITAELVTANIVEPWTYGASTGISALALLLAAAFWTWLWGIPGLFLSTPMTVCVMVVGRYVPALNTLSVLLGSHPVPRPTARFYHRLLALDAQELLSFSLRFIERGPVAEFYDEVFVPALILLEEDRHSGALTHIRQDYLLQSGRKVIEGLEKRSTEPDHRPAVVLGLPARDEADELVALMVRHLLRARGIPAEVSPITASPTEVFARLEKGAVRIVFISALPPYNAAAAARIAAELKERFPKVELLVGFWNRDSSAGPAVGWHESVAQLSAEVEKRVGSREEARAIA